jgi:hypothetical protein
MIYKFFLFLFIILTTVFASSASALDGTMLVPVFVKADDLTTTALSAAAFHGASVCSVSARVANNLASASLSAASITRSRRRSLLNVAA